MPMTLPDIIFPCFFLSVSLLILVFAVTVALNTYREHKHWRDTYRKDPP